MKTVILLFSMVFIFLAVQPVSAFSVFNIYIEENGDAVFLGESDENLVLPEGINRKGNEISGITSLLTNKEGDIWTFSVIIQDAEMNIFLPENAVIKEISGGEIYLDDKNIAVFVTNEVEIRYTIGKKEDNRFGVIVPALVFLMIIAIIIFLIKRKKSKTKRVNAVLNNKKNSILYQVLNEREKLILEKLRKTGRIKGSYLRRLCDIPKASFSRHIQELEKKKLIKRSGEGKNKFVERVNRI